MKMYLKLPIVMVFSSLVLSGCGAGSTTGGQQISATVTSPSTGKCTGLSSGSQCVIQLSYNTQGISGLNLTYSPNPLSPGIVYNNEFTSTFAICQQQALIASSAQATCNVTLTYTTQGGSGTNQNIRFTLGSATSNAINVTGN